MSRLITLLTDFGTADGYVGEVKAVLDAEFSLVFTQNGVRSEPRNVYDLQDEFYLPLSGFRGIERPGPNLEVYVRRGH